MADSRNKTSLEERKRIAAEAQARKHGNRKAEEIGEDCFQFVADFLTKHAKLPFQRARGSFVFTWPAWFDCGHEFILNREFDIDSRGGWRLNYEQWEELLNGEGIPLIYRDEFPTEFWRYIWVQAPQFFSARWWSNSTLPEDRGLRLEDLRQDPFCSSVLSLQLNDFTPKGGAFDSEGLAPADSEAYLRFLCWVPLNQPDQSQKDALEERGFPFEQDWSEFLLKAVTFEARRARVLLSLIRYWAEQKRLIDEDGAFVPLGAADGEVALASITPATSHSDRTVELLKFDSNHFRYNELKKLVQQGTVVPFIGSGMSAATGIPMWSNFLREMQRKADGLSAEELELLLQCGSFETAATRIFEGMPPRLFNEQFERAFVLDNTRIISGPVRYLPELFKSTIITTNFDRVIEHVYEKRNFPFQDTLYGTDIGRYRRIEQQNRRCLLKLHGDYSRSGRVLTTEEYDAFYSPNCPGRIELALLFKTQSLLFIGCSLMGDRTMALLKEEADKDENMISHYAFLKHPDGDIDKRERFLTERSIFPIWYDDDHDKDIEALLLGLNR